MTKRLNKVGVAALWAVIIGAAAALIAAPCEVHAVQGDAKIHIMPFNYSDAILVESDGHLVWLILGKIVPTPMAPTRVTR